MFLPPAPHLRVKYALVTDVELEELHAKAVSNWKKTRLGLAAVRKRRDRERASSQGLPMNSVENELVESRGVESTL